MRCMEHNLCVIQYEWILGEVKENKTISGVKIKNKLNKKQKITSKDETIDETRYLDKRTYINDIKNTSNGMFLCLKLNKSWK